VGPLPAIRGERGDLPLYTLGGGKVRLGDYGAKVTVVAVWASTCVPCIKELPYVDALFQSYAGDRDVSVVALDEDDIRDPRRLAAASEVVARLALHVPVLCDRDVALYRRLNGEEGPHGKPHREVTIPLLAVVDAAFGVRRTFGFKPERSIEEFVREERAVIELARIGKLPPEDRERPPGDRSIDAWLGAPSPRWALAGSVGP
jgi:thiol-disulfide isomerase/thioredoxin